MFICCVLLITSFVEVEVLVRKAGVTCMVQFHENKQLNLVRLTDNVIILNLKWEPSHALLCSICQPLYVGLEL